MVDIRYSHADIVLSMIPLTLLVGHGIGTACDVYAVAMVGALIVAGLLMLDGLFWHAPVE